MTGNSVENDQQSLQNDFAGNERFVRTLAKWALLFTVLIILLDLAVLRNYPFPNALDAIRTPFYTLYAIVMLLGSLFFAFLGYRIISMRYVRHTRALYLIFLPFVILLNSVIWLTLLASLG